MNAVASLTTLTRGKSCSCWRSAKGVLVSERHSGACSTYLVFSSTQTGGDTCWTAYMRNQGRQHP